MVVTSSFINISLLLQYNKKSIFAAIKEIVQDCLSD